MLFWEHYQFIPDHSGNNVLDPFRFGYWNLRCRSLNLTFRHCLVWRFWAQRLARERQVPKHEDVYNQKTDVDRRQIQEQVEP